MTRLQNALISQILIGVAFAIGAFFFVPDYGRIDYK